MAISINDGFTALTDVKKNIGNISEAAKLRAANYIDELFYKAWAGVEPNRFLTNYTFLTTVNVRHYTLPTDFREMAGGGLFATRTGTDFYYLPFDTGTGAFVVGETVTAGSGATAIVREVQGTTATGYLIVSTISESAGSFADNEVLTGSTVGAAVQNGAVTAFTTSETQYRPGGHDSPSNAFHITSSEIVLSQLPSAVEVKQFRYLPIRTVFTALTNNFVVEDWHKEHVLNALLVWYELFDKNPSMESVSAGRFLGVIGDFKSQVSKVSGAIDLLDYDIG